MFISFGKLITRDGHSRKLGWFFPRESKTSTWCDPQSALKIFFRNKSNRYGGVLQNHVAIRTFIQQTKLSSKGLWSTWNPRNYYLICRQIKWSRFIKRSSQRKKNQSGPYYRSNYYVAWNTGENCDHTSGSKLINQNPAMLRYRKSTESGQAYHPWLQNQNQLFLTKYRRIFRI